MEYDEKVTGTIKKRAGGARIAFKKMQAQKKDEYAGFYRGKIEAYNLAIIGLEKILNSTAQS